MFSTLSWLSKKNFGVGYDGFTLPNIPKAVFFFQNLKSLFFSYFFCPAVSERNVFGTIIDNFCMTILNFFLWLDLLKRISYSNRLWTVRINGGHAIAWCDCDIFQWRKCKWCWFGGVWHDCWKWMSLPLPIGSTQGAFFHRNSNWCLQCQRFPTSIQVSAIQELSCYQATFNYYSVNFQDEPYNFRVFITSSAATSSE